MCEILHQVEVHLPETSQDLDQAQADRLVAAVLQVVVEVAHQVVDVEEVK